MALSDPQGRPAWPSYAPREGVESFRRGCALIKAERRYRAWRRALRIGAQAFAVLLLMAALVTLYAYVSDTQG